VIANNPQLARVGSEANRQRAIEAGRAQAALARIALDTLRSHRPAVHLGRWIDALEQRIGNPEATLTELGQDMRPPMSKHAYAALLRRALRGGGITTSDLSAAPRSRRG
jgi:DNA-binding transcriptional regulator WhiA